MPNIEEKLSKKYELTDHHFEIFKEEFNYWKIKYSLNNWEFHYYFEDDEINPTRAKIINDYDSRIALVCLSKFWEGEEPTEEEIRQCAYHECMELFLSRINYLARDRYITEREIGEEIHAIIRTLENVHFYEDLENRKA